MKKLIIAEKPSVAADLAKALGKFTKNDDYFEGENLVISSAIGHIVELFMPDDIDKKLKWWSLATLPILPDVFKLKPIEKTKDRLSLLKKLMAREDISEVINACDAGREGELIFAYIYEAARSKKPIKRMWMSSMTSQSIKEAFEHLKSNEELLPLQAAARCRSESDWLIGINGTRAITSRMFGARSRQIATVGRVQTPTLTLVYEREKAIRSFIPKDYWVLKGIFEIKNGIYEGTYQKPDFKKNDHDEEDRVNRIWDKRLAESILKACEKESEAAVQETKKRSKQAPPLLYDLTTLQREANSRFGMPAGMTLKIAQSLYEKHKAITYPRTDAKALPEDYGATCQAVLNHLSGEYSHLAKKVLNQNWLDTKNKRIFDNKKISDHFAIIPTNVFPAKLADEEKKIYDMIVRRFIAAFYPSAEYDITTRISTIANEHQFKTEGKVLVVPGWLEVHGKNISDKDTLPALDASDKNKAQIKELEFLEEQTKPPARYTEATLLGAMEHAGKFVEDDELADAMKEKGLGTPATRAQIIEHLIREKYIEREQRELIPTIKAENLIEFLKVINIEFLTSPSMTGEWEHQLHQIEVGEKTREAFMKGIKDVTCQIVAQTKDFDESKLDSKETKIISPTDNKPMMETFRSFRSQDEKCIIYKTMGNRKLSQEEIIELIKNKKIGPLDGFKSKAGKPFSAMLMMDEEFKVKFDFGQAGADGEIIDKEKCPVVCDCPMAQKGLCSHKAGKVYGTPTAYQCEYHKEEGSKCNFRVNRTLLSRTIPDDQFLKLVNEGKTDLLDKFKSNKTKRLFAAHLILKDNGAIGFEFAAKAEKSTEKKTSASKKATKKAAKKATKKVSKQGKGIKNTG